MLGMCFGHYMYLRVSLTKDKEGIYSIRQD